MSAKLTPVRLCVAGDFIDFGDFVDLARGFARGFVVLLTRRFVATIIILIST